MPQTKDPTRLYSASEAAKYLGVDDSLVRDLCSRGRLAAQKFGKQGAWLITEAALDTYLGRPRRRGGKTLKQLRARRRHA